MSTALEVKNLNKYYGSNHVLKDISFSMEEGETIAIIGSSGGGKSTLLRSLTFLERIQQGSIYISGEEIVKAEKTIEKPKKYIWVDSKKTQESNGEEDIEEAIDSALDMEGHKANSVDFESVAEQNSNNTSLDSGVENGAETDEQNAEKSQEKTGKKYHRAKVKMPKIHFKKLVKNPITEPYEIEKSIYPKDNELRHKRQKMGLVFQDFNLFPHKTVLENLMLAPMLVKGMSKEEAEGVAYTQLEKVGLAEKANAYPCNISGGQKQRVAIARALCMSPEILCFDEPTSALDPELTGEVLKVISELRSMGVTMVIVTHEIMFARETADRVMFLDQGRILEMGDAKEVIDNPKKKRTREFMDKILKA